MIRDLGNRISGIGFRIYGSRFKVKYLGLGCRVKGLKLRFKV
jgi:hypothetical protein